MKTITVGGEELTVKEATDLIKMLCDDAKQIAGEFHNMERSDKFRVNWPNEYEFAESEWRNFMEAVRAMYAERLGDPKTPPADARRMHLAIVLDTMIGEGKEKDTRLQLAPRTQQFEGERRENKRILEKFGAAPNFRAALRRGASRLSLMN